MEKINWCRMVICGLVTGIVWILLSLVVLLVLGRALLHAMPSFQVLPPSGKVVAACVILPFLVGLGAMWLYAAIPPRFGPGPGTALIAGLFGWAFGFVADAHWITYGFVPPGLALVPLIGSLPALLLAVLAGARFYKESSPLD